jgi:fucose 4-O-acetylase-like acetyltransferase
MHKKITSMARLGLSSSAINAVKGILICLIVLGHLTIFSNYFPMAFNVMYNFHVAGFFFLAMLLVSPHRSRFFIRDRAVRYLVPYGIFVLFTSILYYMVFLYDGTFDEFTVWLKNLFVALIIGSEETLDRVCGIRAYWFLPALLVTVLLRYFYATSSRLSKSIMLIISILGHIFVGLIPQDVKAFIPFSLHIAFFVFPIGILINALWEKFWRNHVALFSLSATLTWIGCIIIGIRWPSYSGIAGGLNVYSIINPLRLLFHDVYAASAFLSILSLSILLGKTGLLPLIGRYSLTIYLSHTLVWYALLQFHLPDFLAPIRSYAVQTGIALLIVLTICTIISVGIAKAPGLSKMIFPRCIAEWPLIKLIST